MLVPIVTWKRDVGGCQMNRNRFRLTRYTKRPEHSGRYFYTPTRLRHPPPNAPHFRSIWGRDRGGGQGATMIPNTTPVFAVDEKNLVPVSDHLKQMIDIPPT